ncbi:MAG: enoyl-CoA hydratase/isomerase family protein [Acidaminococcaceae bacterium]|nr:enoyl-CoA hydratase/isomerase family protein [Acidaminococcaceae bacterium]MBR1590724.1 enoyl-CoA hydratase/isomerase family protein [Acidaminococcaceae bacterium]
MLKTNLTIEQGVAILMLKDPEHLNPLDQATDIELLERLEFCEQSADVKVVVLGGAGRSFSAGGDMRFFKKQLDEKNYAALDALAGHVNRVILKIRMMKKLVIAAVQGYAVGGGANLALASDFIIADQSCKFSEPFTKIGLAPDAGAMYLLSRAVGARKALQICAECPVIKADEADKLGLLTRLVPEGEALTAAIAFAEKLANGPLLAYEMAKEQNNRINYSDFEEYLFNAEKETVGKTFRSEDYREAVTAFLEKRATHYSGR